jgi:hypothetical protein
MAQEMMALEQDRLINEMQVALQQQEQDLVEDSAQRMMATGI